MNRKLTGATFTGTLVTAEDLSAALAEAAVLVAKTEALPPNQSVLVRIHHNIDTETGDHELLLIGESF